MIVALLAAIVLLLFYKLIERKHRIVLLKMLGTVLALSVVAAGGIIGYDRLSEAARVRENSKVTVKYSPPIVADSAPAKPSFDDLIARASGKPRTLQAISFEMCNGTTRRLDRLNFRASTYAYERSTPRQLTVSSDLLYDRAREPD